jgi:hypothetical protein
MHFLFVSTIIGLLGGLVMAYYSTRTARNPLTRPSAYFFFGLGGTLGGLVGGLIVEGVATHF